MSLLVPLRPADGTPSRWSISIAAPPAPEAARRLKISPFWIWSWRVRMPCMSVSGPGGQPGHVDVDRHDLVDALDDRVVVEHPAAARAHAHGDDPLGLDHLVVDLAQHRGHLLAHATGDDHEVGLARAGAEDLHAPAREVVVRGAGRHHLDRAAREPERGRPHRALARPVDEVFDARGEEVVADRLEAHYAAFPGSSGVACRARRPRRGRGRRGRERRPRAARSRRRCAVACFTGPHSSAPVERR